MLVHYIVVAWRNLIKYKLQTIISIIGLVVGMVFFSMSALWLRYLNSFDQFHEDADRICLVSRSKVFNDDSKQCYIDAEFIHSYILSHCSDVLDACAIKSMACMDVPAKIKTDDKDSEQTLHVAAIDSCFYRMFDVELLKGKRLPSYGEVVLTDAMSEKLFGSADGMGNTVIIQEDDYSEPVNLVVVGIVRPWTEKSLFSFDALLAKDPNMSIKDRENRGEYVNFIKIKDGVNIDSLQSRLRRMELNYQSVDNNIAMGDDLAVIPINRLMMDAPPEFINMKSQYVPYFMLIGCLVIFCSLCNYCVSMVTRIRIRSREMSMRQLFGAKIIDIISMVSCETVILFVFTIIGGILLEVLLIPELCEISGIDDAKQSIIVESFIYMVFAMCIGLVVVALTVWIVLRTTQRSIIEGRTSRRGSGYIDRIGLWLQLAVSTCSIFCVVVIMMQLHFILKTDALGLDRTDVGLLRIDGENRGCEDYKEFIRNSPLVTGYADCQGQSLYPPGGILSMPIVFTDKPLESADDYNKGVLSNIFVASSNVMEFYGLKPVYGKLNKDNDWSCILVNEAFCRKQGIDNPVGKSISMFNDQEYKIVGVLPDIYINTPEKDVDPAIYLTKYPWNFITCSDFLFRTQSGRLPEVIEELEKMKESGKCSTSDVKLMNLEDMYSHFLTSELMLSKLLLVVAGVSVLISIIGVFSIISLSLEQRRKEIAIRRINGAKKKDILNIFLSSHIIVLLVSSVCAFPLGYYIMTLWLEQYSKYVSLPLWLCPAIFVSLFLLIFLIVYAKVTLAMSDKPAEMVKE